MDDNTAFVLIIAVIAICIAAVSIARAIASRHSRVVFRSEDPEMMKSYLRSLGYADPKGPEDTGEVEQ